MDRAHGEAARAVGLSRFAPDGQNQLRVDHRCWHLLPVLLSLVSILSFAPATAAAATLKFDNDCGTKSWFGSCFGNTKTNWDNEGTPGAGDDVTIDAGLGPVSAGAGGGTTLISIKSLHAPGGLKIGSIDFLVLDPSEVTGLDWQDALITSSATGSVPALTMNGNSVWRTNGRLQGLGPGSTLFRNESTLDIMGLGIIMSAQFENMGAVLQRSQLVLHPDAVVKNGQLWVLNNNNANVQKFQETDANTARFDNTGVLRNADGKSSVSVVFTSDAPGQIEIRGGELDVLNQAFFGGPISIAAGARLVAMAPSFATQTFRGNVDITGEGQLELKGAPGFRHQISGALTNKLAGGGSLLLNEVDMHIDESSKLENAGLLLWEMSGAVRGTGIFLNFPGAQLTISNGTAALGVAFDNEGTVEQNAPVTVEPGAGILRNESDGTLQINAALALGAGLDNKGLVAQNAPVTVEPGVTVVNEKTWMLKSEEISSDESPMPGRFQNLDLFEVEAGPGSTIALPFDQEGQGRLSVPAGASVVLRGGGTWSSEPLPLDLRGLANLEGSAQGPKEYRVQGEEVMDGEGLLTVKNNATLSIANSLAAFLTVTLAGGTMKGPGRFSLGFGGSGVLRVEGGKLGTPDAPLHIVSGAEGFVQIAGSDISMNGTLESDAEVEFLAGARLSLEDASEISVADFEGSVLGFDGNNVVSGSGSIHNSGTLFQRAGSSMVAVLLNNDGLVSVDSGTLELAGGVRQVAGNVLTGGKWLVEPGAKLIIDNAVIDTIGPNAGVVIGRNDVDGSAFQRLRRVDGKATVLEALISSDFSVGSPGQVLTGLGEGRRSRVRAGSQGDALRGAAATARSVPVPTTPSINFELGGGPFRNEGLVIPGGEGGISSFGIDGDYTQTATGALHLDVAPDEYDQLSVTGAATLDGMLEVTLLDGYAPQPGDTIIAVTAASLSGKFANATDRLFVNGGAFDVTYTETSVVLSGFDANAVSPTPGPMTPAAGGTATPTATPNPNGSPTPTPNATQSAIATPSVPTPTPTPRPADVNLDGKVDSDDLDLIITRIFAPIGPGAPDVNNDGRVEAADIPAWLLRQQE